MKAYVVADIEVTDPVRYQPYGKAGEKVVWEHGGKFLARGGTATTLEGGWAPKRFVIIEFPDRAAAERWYGSPGYAAARKLREGAATWRAVIVDGMPA